MELLSRRMDPIDRARHYIEQLKDLSSKLNKISYTLQHMKKNNLADMDEYKRLYEKEFELSMEIYGVHGDVHKLLDGVKVNGNAFLVKRLKQEADKIFIPLVVDVK